MSVLDADAIFAQRTSSAALAGHAGTASTTMWFHATQTTARRMIRIRATNSTTYQSQRPQSATSCITPPFSNSPANSLVQKSRRHTSSSYFGITPTEFNIWAASSRRSPTVRLKRLQRRMTIFAAPMTCKLPPNMRCSEPLRASSHQLPPPPFRPPCSCCAALSGR